MSDLPTYVLERTFDAPRELVWRTWTEADLLNRWYGPGVETEVHKLDVSEGGVWLHEMKMGENSMHQRMDYVEVDPPSKLVMKMSNADAGWNIISSPMMENWPKTLLTTVTFTENGDKTDMRLEWVPFEASDAELQMFAGAIAGLDSGWGKGMEELAKVLEELKA